MSEIKNESQDINELVVLTTANELANAQKVDSFLDQVIGYKEILAKKEEEFRQACLTAMCNNSVLSIKTEKYTISQVVPKDTVTFDTDRFLKEADPFIVEDYTSYKKKKELDLDALLAAHPELEIEFTKTVEIPEVDLKTLEKQEPAVYNEYKIVTPSKKSRTLRIAANK